MATLQASWTVEDMEGLWIRRAEVNGQLAWSNGYVVELAEPDSRLRQARWWPDQPPAFKRDGIDDLAPANPRLATMLGPLRSGVTYCVLGVKPDWLRFVQPCFVAYFAERYPGCEWWIDGTSYKPVEVRHKGRRVGLVMPYFVGDEVQEQGRAMLWEQWQWGEADGQLAGFRREYLSECAGEEGEV